MTHRLPTARWAGRWATGTLTSAGLEDFSWQPLRPQDRAAQRHLVAVRTREIDAPRERGPQRVGSIERNRDEGVRSEIGTAGEDVAQIGRRRIVLVQRRDSEQQIHRL